MKKYTLLVYKNSNQFTIINFNTAAAAIAQAKAEAYRLAAFEINNNME